MLSAGDIASYDMQTITQNRIDDLPLFNLLSVLEGTLVNELNCTVSEVSGELYIALPQNYEDTALTNPDCILICGDQPDIIERAIASGVRASSSAAPPSARSGRRPAGTSASSPPRSPRGACRASSIRRCPWSASSSRGGRSSPSA